MKNQKKYTKNKNKEWDYVCKMCKRKFKIDLIEYEEAKNEMKELWGDIPLEEQVIICDDCFNKIPPKKLKNLARKYKKLPH